MFKNKYEATKALNKVIDLAISLNVKYIANHETGITIFENNKPKFFGLNQKEFDKACRYIKKVADPSLQTHF